MGDPDSQALLKGEGKLSAHWHARRIYLIDD
jgi:hypothetical protein